MSSSDIILLLKSRLVCDCFGKFPVHVKTMVELVPSGELLLWVLLSITFMAFVTIFMRTPLLLLLKTQPTYSPLSWVTWTSLIRKSGILRRSLVTRNNGSYIPRDQFLYRKHLFVSEPEGLLQLENKEDSNGSPHPSMKSLSLSSLMKPRLIRSKILENIANVGPQMALGAWIRSMFHGYIVCCLPFWVPEHFRSMLQSGMEVSSMKGLIYRPKMKKMIGDSLDIRYVSGLSWYILNIFGLQGFIFLLDGKNEQNGLELASDTPEMQTNILIKQEMQLWKETDYHWKLENIEEELLNEEDSIEE